jgi:hypothetical protein
MRCTTEIDSCGMIQTPNFMKIGTGIEATFKV